MIDPHHNRDNPLKDEKGGSMNSPEQLSDIRREREIKAKIVRFRIYSIIAAFIPIIGPAAIIILSLIFIKNSRYREFLIWGIGIFLCHLSCCAPLAIVNDIFGAHIHEKNAVLKVNISSIQVTIERYARDHNGFYPSDIQQVIDQQYISSFPKNPYVKEKTLMFEVPFGSESFEGNFTYIPITSEKGIDDYLLIGYGSKKESDLDINGDNIPDHVLIWRSGKEDALTNIKDYLKPKAQPSSPTK